MKRIILLSIITLFASLLYFHFSTPETKDIIQNYAENHDNNQILKLPEQEQSNNEALVPPTKKTLSNNYHIYQTFNNCGPASLSMALSYYNTNVSQEQLGQELRPFQHPDGDNDDKSVTIEELAKKAEEYGFVTYHRPNGDIELIQNSIALNIPVIVKTWLSVDEDTGHYRVIKGYDDNKKIVIQDDSMQGKNKKYSYEDLDKIWKKYNYEFLLIVPTEKQELVNKVIGQDLDTKVAWKRAANNAKQQIESDPMDLDARFNLIVALYNIGDFESAVTEFEKIEPHIKLKRLWYQIEPLASYYQLQNYDRVLSLSEKIINNGNRAYSELYIIRGNVYKAQGDLEKAKEEYEKAKTYNKYTKVPEM